MPATEFRTRIGGATIELDAYGGDFTSPVDLGVPNEEGVTVIYEADYAELKDGVSLGLREIEKIAHNFSFECLLIEHRARNIALSFGFPTAQVTDNSGDDVPNESFEFSDYQPQTYYRARVRAPQAQDVALYDVWTGYRMAPMAKFNQAVKIGGHRFIPVMLKATQDPDNSNKLGGFYSEYDDGDLP